MTLEQQSELRLLQIRNAIADKERYTASANQELGQGGWRCDWSIAFWQAEKQIEYLTEQLKRGE